MVYVSTNPKTSHTVVCANIPAKRDNSVSPEDANAQRDNSSAMAHAQTSRRTPTTAAYVEKVAWEVKSARLVCVCLLARQGPLYVAEHVAPQKDSVAVVGRVSHSRITTITVEPAKMVAPNRRLVVPVNV
tara:strand:- start:6266 stop:6655 length:390 start_codon:yes stop_codon:yes gene_type:complete